MRTPRGLAKRIDDIEKAIRLRLPEKPTEDEIRHEIRTQLAEEKFLELIRVWESEFETILNGFSEREITEAVKELVSRIKREPIMETDAWGPKIREMSSGGSEGGVKTLADVYVIITENLQDSELRRIRMEGRDSEGWELNAKEAST